MSIEINFPFTTPGNYDFDTSKIEVTGGVAKLKDMIAEDKATYGATFFANYETDINGLWGNGSLIGTPYNGATIANGKLDLKANGKLVDYVAVGNGDSQQQGCIRMQVIPDFSGIGNIHDFICITKAHSDDKNYIYLSQHHNGQMKVVILDKDSALITSTLLSVWNPVQGQVYEFELNWDITLGETRLFIDGIQCGSTITGTGIRDNNIGVIRIGSDFNQNGISNSEIENILIFNKVQHTIDYTPDWTIVPITIYSLDNSTIEPTTEIRVEKLENFIETSTKTGSDEIKYILKKGTQWYYHNGTNWVYSDQTYAQSNTEAEVLANIDTFDGEGSVCKVKIFLHSDAGDTTPEIDNLKINYDYYGDTPDTISTCIVWCHNSKIDNNPDTRLVEIELNKDYVKYKNNIGVINEKMNILPDSSGYWEIELIENANMESGSKYLFKINDVIYEKAVPNEDTKNFWDLI